MVFKNDMNPTIAMRKIGACNHGFNYIWKLKMSLPTVNFFFNSKWFFQLATKIVDNVELNPQHSQSLHTCVNFSTNIEVTKN